MKGTFLVSIILLFLVACSQPSSMSNSDQILLNLNILTSGGMPHGFVIFEHSDSRKFVQFGWDGESIQLDLPTQPLSQNDLSRARNLFADHNVELETWKLYVYEGGPEAGDQSGFQMYFGSDTETAAKLAMDVFTVVYGYEPDFPLTISNGE
jgi:hypothetical protein